jgi:hypothetical protein
LLIEDLRAGRFPPDAYELVHRTFTAVTWRRNFPPPEGAGGWTPELIQDAVQDFLTDRTGQGRLSRIALRAGDDAEFKRLLDVAVKNFLIDRVRKGARAKLWRRLNEVLGADARFVEVGDSWTLRELPAAERWAGREADLVAAAWRVEDVRVVRWRPDARRDGPVADRTALVAVCAAIIEAAGAPVPLSTLTEVVAQRFNVGAPPLLILVDAPELAEHPVRLQGAVSTEALPSELVGAARVQHPGPERLIAEEIWGQLGEQERMQLPVLDLGVRAQGEVLGLGHSQAAKAAARLKEKLRVLLGDEDEPTRQEIVRHLQEMQASWAFGRGSSPDR